MPGILATLAPLLNHYGYLAVGGLVLAEDFGIPVPGETILLAAAVYAGAGQLNITVVGIIAFLGAVLGDNIGYAIGHFAGRRIVLRFGRYLFLTDQRLNKAENIFNRHGSKVVTVARFIEGLRQANGIVAGTATMPWRRFLAFNALGAALWAGLWSTVGYLAGNHIDALYTQGRHYELYLGIALAVPILAVTLHHTLRQRAHHHHPKPRDHPS